MKFTKLTIVCLLLAILTFGCLQRTGQAVLPSAVSAESCKDLGGSECSATQRCDGKLQQAKDTPQCCLGKCVKLEGVQFAQDDADKLKDAPSSISGAFEILPGEYKENLLDEKDAADVFAFTLPEGSKLEFKATPNYTTGLDIALYAYDKEGNDVTALVSGGLEKIDLGKANYGEGFFLISGSTHGNIPLFVKVQKLSGKGQYTVSLSVEKQNDVQTGKDAPDTIDAELPIIAGSTDFGGNLLGYADAFDFYQLSLQEGKKVKITAEPASDSDLDIAIAFYNPEKKDLTKRLTGEWNVDTGKKSAAESIEFVFDSGKKPEPYYFKVKTISGDGSYKIILQQESQNDADSGKDAADTLESPLEIKPGKYENNYLGYLDIADTYKITPGDAKFVTVKVVPKDSKKVDLLFDIFGAGRHNVKPFMLARSFEAHPGKGEPGEEYLQWRVYYPDYYIRVFRVKGDTGEYSLEVSLIK